MAGQQVQLEIAHAAAGEVGVFIQHDAGAEQGIGERRQHIEVGDIPVVEIEIVDALLGGIHVHGVVGIAAPVVGAHVQAVEEALLGIDDREIQAQQTGTLAQIHHAAIDVVVAADAGEAIAQVDAAGNPRLGGGVVQARRPPQVEPPGGCAGCCAGVCGLLRQQWNRDQQSQCESHLSKSWLTYDPWILMWQTVQFWNCGLNRS